MTVAVRSDFFLSFAVGNGAEAEVWNLKTIRGMKQNENKGWGASSMTPRSDKLINKPEAAEILRISVRTLDRLLCDGIFKRIQVSKRRVCLIRDEVLKHAGISPNPSLS